MRLRRSPDDRPAGRDGAGGLPQQNRRAGGSGHRQRPAPERQHRGEKHPQRIVVLDYASLETLQLLGVEPLALPGNRKNLPDSLKRYQDDKYLNAGTLFEPDMAVLRAAKPDLILIAGRASKAYDELNALAPTLNMSVDPQDQLGSLKQRTLQLGELFDKQQQAQAAVDKLDAQIAAVKPQAAQAGRGLVVLFSGGKISAYAPKSRFSFVYDALGSRLPCSPTKRRARQQADA